ncbi:hypothetical protein AVEN_179582-1 [Araneus ventricosus]|uniref:Uncharacterized protein n=1 Tax=Araneus ventricosus TaxID=182803 RepID=A0A4Y2BE48_ARAVE|nr:hypothetical protein AVEN_179582-1 [Araneus ventricosus]
MFVANDASHFPWSHGNIHAVVHFTPGAVKHVRSHCYAFVSHKHDLHAAILNLLKLFHGSSFHCEVSRILSYASFVCNSERNVRIESASHYGLQHESCPRD